MTGMRFERVVLLVALIVVLPLLMGAGGSNPPPFEAKIVGPTFLANVVLDPHEIGITTTAKRATIRLYSASNTAAAMFNIPALGFTFLSGCDLTLTETRFRHVTLISWIPEAVLNQVFQELGFPRSANFEPIITQIVNDHCTPDPANPAPTQGLPGILSFQAWVRFQVPK